MPRTCSNCKTLGHTKRACPTLKIVNEGTSSPPQSVQDDAFTSKSLLADYQSSEDQALKTHVESMRLNHPILANGTDEEIMSILNHCNSYSQSRRSVGGKELETRIETHFTKEGQPYRRQVRIKDGIIQDTKSTKGMKIVDIVFGNPQPGDHISNYAIMSLKTSSRERASEDDWTLIYRPKLYLYASLKADYPAPEKFQESESRKLVCATPKPEDTRRFKLGFEDILREVCSVPTSQ